MEPVKSESDDIPGASGLPLPPRDVILRATPVDFTGMYGRHRKSTSWPFGYAALHRLVWYVSTWRQPKDQDAHLVPKCTVLELYVGYLLANDDVRFESDIPDTSHGNWLSVQIVSFTRALTALQHLILFAALVGTCPEEKPTCSTPTQAWLACIPRDSYQDHHS